MKALLFIAICYCFIASNGIAEYNRYLGFRMVISRMIKTKDLTWERQQET